VVFLRTEYVNTFIIATCINSLPFPILVQKHKEHTNHSVFEENQHEKSVTLCILILPKLQNEHKGILIDCIVQSSLTIIFLFSCFKIETRESDKHSEFEQEYIFREMIIKLLKLLVHENLVRQLHLQVELK